MRRRRTKRASKRREPPQVAVLVDTSTGWGRRLIQGVCNYAAKHGPWHLWVEPRGRSEALRLPAGWNGDGIIARVSTKRLANELRACRRPVVNISAIAVKGQEFPRVSSNYTSMAKLAIEHFRDRGYRRFAYVGPLKYQYVRRHAEEFRAQAARFNGDCHVFDHIHESMTRRNWIKRRQELGDWIVELPKPIAVFSWATNAGAQLLDVCRYRGVVVPDDVAVLAGDDDELICSATTPPMSAVLVASEQIGYRAAARLDRLMARGRDPRRAELIDPIQVTARQSTEAIAIEDPDLARAVRYLRLNALSNLSVAEIADAVPMTRRSLERKFRQMFDRSPLEEIQRLRLAHAKERLVTTDSPIWQVAESSGFGSPEYMTTLFKAEFGVTPLRFRSQARAR